ncbi:NUDIX domain-containing protein [Litoribacter ruber]|uniref:NUDIX domain-containing protein n=1 Tax=Litoribacter ruber TaxID=702568 RepID=A0AAP2CFB0_9BACT|nr:MULTISPECIES: NUDIX domain-containing protein [Litoribacter]MBS9522857.1 NUDIX domain-containing protein [Litoribacter alkaliphilus]MBT0812364.1 NUDIX domain-containing protein [Litoribacter ruber]
MPNIEKEISDKFGGRLRVRVNGVLIKEDKILMIRHDMGQGRSFWNVPGGGMKFGSPATANLAREFAEETGLEIRVEKFLFTFEYLDRPLHAVELFFEVSTNGQNPQLGHDPELPAGTQLIQEVKFMDLDELQSIPNEAKHQVFWDLKSLNDVRIWKGYFNFENKCIK